MKSFDERLKRLEKLSEKLKGGNIPLEEAVALFEEGMALAKGLEKELTKVERKVQILMSESEHEPGKKEPGEPVLELFPEMEENEE